MVVDIKMIETMMMTILTVLLRLNQRVRTAEEVATNNNSLPIEAADQEV